MALPYVWAHHDLPRAMAYLRRLNRTSQWAVGRFGMPCRGRGGGGCRAGRRCRGRSGHLRSRDPVVGLGPGCRGCRHPTARQVSSRSMSALRWAGVKSRFARPRSRSSDFPPRTAGMILALQANRRVSAAEMASPVRSSPGITCGDPDPGARATEQSRGTSRRRTPRLFGSGSLSRPWSSDGRRSWRNLRAGTI